VASKFYRPVAQLYDDEYADLPMLQQDVAHTLNRLRNSQARVLVGACGTGRTAIPLALAGHTVVGIDIDAKALALAKQRQKSAGISRDALRLIRADLTRFEFEGLHGTVDHALLPFNGLNLFTTIPEADAVLSGLRDCLKPGGTLIVDVFNPETSQMDTQHTGVSDVHRFYSAYADAKVTRRIYVSAGARPQVRLLHFEYAWRKQGVSHRREIDFELVALYPREIQLLFERNGFDLIKLEGDYDGADVDNASERIIATGAKS